jgi:glycosyltransferase involved in cell wall biosynthesis
MKVVILFNGKYPGHSPGAKRISLYQKGLKECGHSAEIVPSSFFPKTIVLIYLIPLIAPFVILLKAKRQLNECDVIFSYGFGWWAILILSIYTKITNRKLAIEVNEKPGSTYGSRFTEFWFVKKFNMLGTRFLAYKLVDGFVVISGTLRDFIEKHKSSNALIFTVPILIDVEEMQVPGEEVVIQKPFVLHAGALSERKDGITTVFKAFALVTRKLNNTLHFYLTSKVAPRDVWQRIQTTILENNLQENIHFLGEIPERKLRAYQHECCMLIINKLGEYLALEKPVIATAVGEMANYLKHECNALIVPADNAEQTASAMLRLLNDATLSASIGKQGKKLAEEEFCYKNHGERLSKFLFNLCKRNKLQMIL